MSKKEWKRRRWQQKREKRAMRALRGLQRVIAPMLNTPERPWFTL